MSSHRTYLYRLNVLLNDIVLLFHLYLRCVVCVGEHIIPLVSCPLFPCRCSFVLRPFLSCWCCYDTLETQVHFTSVSRWYLFCSPFSFLFSVICQFLLLFKLNCNIGWFSWKSRFSFEASPSIDRCFEGSFICSNRSRYMYMCECVWEAMCVSGCGSLFITTTRLYVVAFLLRFGHVLCHIIQFSTIPSWRTGSYLFFRLFITFFQLLF